AKAGRALSGPARAGTGHAASVRPRGQPAAAAADHRGHHRRRCRRQAYRSNPDRSRRMIGMLNPFRRTRQPADDTSIVMDSARKSTGGRTRNRVVMTMAVFFGIYAIIGGRLVYLGFQDPMPSGAPASRVTAA